MESEDVEKIANAIDRLADAVEYVGKTIHQHGYGITQDSRIEPSPVELIAEKIERGFEELADAVKEIESS